MSENLRLAKFPFVTGAHPDESFRKELPEHLPLELTFDQRSGLVHQTDSKLVDETVEKAYKIGSMLSTPLGQGNQNSPLVKELLENVAQACGGGIAGKDFFEPGCGTGFLLKQLQAAGAGKLLGCEPGPQARTFPRDTCFEVRQEFFTPEKFPERFDCVYHYGCLEHIKHPSEFLRSNVAMLKPGGTLFVAVPSCEKDFATGNFMALAHEHYNYFTGASLTIQLQMLGLENVKARHFQYSQGIVAVWGQLPAVKSTNAGSRTGTFVPDAKILTSEKENFAQFVIRTQKYLELLQARIRESEAAGRSIGLYGSPRAFAGLMEFKTPPRVFDGDSAKTGMYFCGSPRAIESPQALVDKPVDELWILPIHHDRPIRNFLEREILPKTPQMKLFSVLDFTQSKN